MASSVGKRLSPVQMEHLAGAISEDEFHSAFCSMGKNKSLGPNGFTAHFFKVTWSIISEDFVWAIKYFFITVQMRKAVNSMIITLVPEHDQADKMKDFRPISSCNVTHRCIMKA